MTLLHYNLPSYEEKYILSLVIEIIYNTWNIRDWPKVKYLTFYQISDISCIDKIYTSRRIFLPSYRVIYGVNWYSKLSVSEKTFFYRKMNSTKSLFYYLCNVLGLIDKEKITQMNLTELMYMYVVRIFTIGFEEMHISGLYEKNSFEKFRL